MGVFYMSHFIHGTKVACSEVEVKHDESHGWVLYDPSVQSQPAPEEPANTPPKRPIIRKVKE
jgi:hypothetical protein